MRQTNQGNSWHFAFAQDIAVIYIISVTLKHLVQLAVLLLVVYGNVLSGQKELMLLD
jgi:hypothetical protein